MTGRLVPSNGVDLWVEIDGQIDHPTIALLGGSDASALRWPRQLVDELIAAGRAVLRIEHRDSGLSTKIDPDQPYRLEDLAADVVGVLDALGIDDVDLVGYSMGGAVAQLVALEHPHRVRTLVLVATTPGLGDEKLPFAEDWFVDKMAERYFAPPPRTLDDRVAWTVDLYRLLAGPRYAFDEAGQRALAAAEIERAWVPESGHGVAANASASRLGRLHEITTPTVVVHGTDDPVYPPAHGRALAEGLHDAELVEVEGLGHEIPAAYAGELAAVVRRLLQRAQPERDRGAP